MYNTYISSTLLSLRTKGSLAYSFNDCSNFLNERCDGNPLLASSQCCSCCNCCCSCCASSFATNRVPVNPSFVYGLRQSSLIQWLPARRPILGGRDRCYYRIPAIGIDHGCYEVFCSFKEKNGGQRIERGRQERVRRMKSRERRCLSGFDDVDAVICLLSEEYLGDRERNESMSKRVKVARKQNYGGECHRERKKNVRLGLLESSSKCEFESVTVDSRKEGGRRKEEREDKEQRESWKGRGEKVANLKDENCLGRKSSSSLSSYHSLASSGDFESEEEGEDENGSFLEESSVGHREALSSKESGFEKQLMDRYRGHKDHVEKKGKVLEQGIAATRTNVEWDLRKKSEKKLSDVEEMQYGQESSQMHSKVAKAYESDYTNASSSHMQIADEVEKSNSAINLDKGRKMQHDQSQVSELSEFRRNYKEKSEAQEIHGRNFESTSQHQKRFSSREENLTVDNTELSYKRGAGNHRTVGTSGGKDSLRRESQQLVERPDIRILDNEGVSNLHRQSESRTKIREEDKVPSSIRENKKLHHQSGEQIAGKIESRTSQQFSEMSEICDSYSKETSSLQLERKKNQEERTIIVPTSGIEMKDQRPQDVTNISVNVTNSKNSFNETMTGIGSEGMSIVKPSQATSRGDKQKLEITSSSQASQNVDSRARVQPIEREDRDRRGSQVVMMPPSPQLLTRDSMRFDSSSGITTQEDNRGTSESRQGALYNNLGGRSPASRQEPYTREMRVAHEEHINIPIPVDSLGSVQRLEESSVNFVGEFIEKARHEVSTSEIQMEKTVFDTELIHEGEMHKQKSSSQYSSEESQLKGRDSRRLSGGSAAKGPSDEMWDVTDPSAQGPQETEAPEGSTATENTVVRRNGRSLWSIIGNIVQLRWGSRPETPKSARRSSGKSTSNDSVSSETWFSGHEPDENSDGNVKRENIDIPKEASSSQQLPQRQTSNRGQTSGSKDTSKQLEGDISLPSVIPKSGSSSKSTSSVFEEENLGWRENRKSSQVILSGTDIRQSATVSLPSSAMSSPVMEESSGTGKMATSASGFMEPIEQHISSTSSEVTSDERKEGDLKQRKLQRNKQVVRDRFDEWEEAYIHESEQRKIDERFMREALLEAKKAADTWEVPVGAVLVLDGNIIARGYNLVEELRDSTAHAEMICIREGSNQLRTWRLSETTLYVTLEPCPMCAGAILQARIPTVVWGAPNKLLGADGSWVRLFPNGGGNGSEITDKPAAPIHPFHPNMTIRRGIMESECAEVMQQFFKRRRTKKQKNEDEPPQPPCLPLANRQSKFLHKMHHIFHSLFCL